MLYREIGKLVETLALAKDDEPAVSELSTEAAVETMPSYCGAAFAFLVGRVESMV